MKNEKVHQRGNGLIRPVSQRDKTLFSSLRNKIKKGGGVMKSCKGKALSMGRYALPLLILMISFGIWNSVAMAVHTNITSTEDIRNTKHNMTRNPDILVNSTAGTGTTEVCIFCHTPHGANPTLSGLAPLWQRNVSPGTAFIAYSTPNFDASGLDAGRPKGVSLACLSCHDGNIAIDALINAPGSGGFEELNRTTDGASISLLWTFTASGIVGAGNKLTTGFRDGSEQDTTTDSPYSGGIHDTLTGGTGLEGAEPFPNLGLVISDDHPVGMQVPTPNFNANTAGQLTTDPQFLLIGTFSNLDGHPDDGKSVMYITKNGQYPLDKRDRIRAYPSTGEAGSYWIECATCHNPHTPRVSFLRLPSGQGPINGSTLIGAAWNSADAALPWAKRPNSGSAICLSCHQK